MAADKHRLTEPLADGCGLRYCKRDDRLSVHEEPVFVSSVSNKETGSEKRLMPPLAARGLLRLQTCTAVKRIPDPTLRHFENSAQVAARGCELESRPPWRASGIRGSDGDTHARVINMPRRGTKSREWPSNLLAYRAINSRDHTQRCGCFGATDGGSRFGRG